MFALSKTKSVIFLGVVAALFTAVYKAMDNITVHNFIIAPDGLTAAFSYLIVGGWTGCVFGVLFSLLFGKRLIDPDFSGIVFKNAKMHKNAAIAGFISAGSTLFLLWGNQFGDAGAITALSSTMLFFVMIYDVMTKQAGKRILIPMIAAVIGSMLAAYSGSVVITLTGVLYVVVISNSLGLLSEVAEQKGVRASDGVNLFIWRFFWLATGGTAIALTVSWMRGYSDMLFATILNSVVYLPFIIVAMLFVFLGVGIKLTLKKKRSLSIVLLLSTIQIAFAFPITIIGEWLKPGLFGGISDSPVVWMIRGAGILLLIWSVISLRDPIPKEET